MNKYFFHLVFLLSAFTSYAQTTSPHPGVIRQMLKKLNTLGSVMYVAAHPDDENTRLLTWLDNERHYRTVYLSVTRGDGGQNLIGKEQGSELGMIRTRELLAARSIDGAEQFFTRANDFGYSKSPEETFSIWGKENILADVVWAIRKFKPDVIINRFPTTGEGGHGHHTASAILAIEAFKAAGDPLRFPEQLKYAGTWQPKRIFHNSFVPRGQPNPDFTGQLSQDAGGYNPLLGESYGVMAASSRSMHKSQGFGVASTRGVQLERFRKLDGDTAVNDVFEGIALGWNRADESGEIQKLVSKCEAGFRDENPELIVNDLILLHDKIQMLKDPYWKEVKLNEINNLIAACTGLWFEANASGYKASPGDSVYITAMAICRLKSNVFLERVSILNRDTLISKELKPNEPFSFTSGMIVPEGLPYSFPYYINQTPSNGIYDVPDQQLRGQPTNTSHYNAAFRFRINGTQFTYTIPLGYKFADPVKGEVHRPFEVVPPVSIRPADNLIIFNNQESKKFSVVLEPGSSLTEGKLTFAVPQGYKVSPAFADVTFPAGTKEITREFVIEKVPGSANDMQPAELLISLESRGKIYKDEIRRIEYDHIPAIVSSRKSAVKIINPGIKQISSKIGYIEGAGDEVANCLRLAGYDVTILDENKIMNTDLSVYGAIITGIRTYNTNEKMDLYYKRLMNYIEAGGNMVVQYNTSNFISAVSSQIGPYPFKISRDRVTEENAEVTFPDPAHYLLQSPNVITKADFENWVQERGLYFASDPAPEYQGVVSWNDKGEKPLNNGLIVAKKGKGHFIYTGISFFRQLPAGVPGAYRIMANLIDAGRGE